MASLVTPVDPKSQALIEVVAAGYRIGGSKWPIWQYVDLTLAAQRIDAEEAFRGLPVWNLNYRPAWTTGNGVVPIPGDHIALSVHGMHHSKQPYMTDLGNGFVGALRTVAQQRGQLEPDPQYPVEFRLESDALTAKANWSAGVNLSTEQLGSILQREPSTWNGYVDGSTGSGSVWRFDVTKQARLAPYADVTDTEGYLLVLERLVGYPPQALSTEVRPPLAVPEALDHLDLTWRLATGLPPMLSVSSPGVVAALTQPAHSREEFESRCSSLVDVMKQFNIEPTAKKKQHKLEALKDTLSNQDGIEMAAALYGLELLRAICDVRNGLQHATFDAQAEAAQQRLGLRTWEGNWDASWNIIRAAAVDGFNGVRSSLRGIIDDRASEPATSE